METEVTEELVDLEFAVKEFEPPEDEFTHEVHEDNEDVSLCGKYIPGDVWTDEPIDCPQCLLLSDQHYRCEYCPICGW